MESAFNHIFVSANHTSNNLCQSLSQGMATEPMFTTEFVVHGILILLFGLLGLVVNAVCMFVHCRSHVKDGFNCLLIGLAIVDAIVILSAFDLFCLPAFQVTIC